MQDYEITHLKRPAKLVYCATKVPMVVVVEAKANPTKVLSPMYQRKPYHIVSVKSAKI
jgi:hypothetical protein